MMTSDFDRALGLLMGHEGGFSNAPADRGGATNYGITQATYDGWRRKRGLPVRGVAQVTPAEVQAIYDEGYWAGAGCDKLPWPLSYLVFDAAVNSGPARAVTWLQQGLGVPVDSDSRYTPAQRVGPKTIAAAQRATPAQVLAVAKARADFLADLIRKDTTQLAFIKGWWRRTLDVLGTALAA